MPATSTAAVAARPAFSIAVDGSPLPLGPTLSVTSIRVEQDVVLPGMLALDLAGGDVAKQTGWIDGTLFTIGSAVEVKLGHGDALASVIEAEITGLEPAFHRDLAPRLTIRAYDRRHRLQRGQRTRSFLPQKVSDIAASIASDAGLTAQATDSQVVHEYVLQACQTDLEFLQEQARLIRYELAVEGRSLLFRPEQNDQGEVLTLTPGDDLVEFLPRLSTVGQRTEVAVRGWSAKQKKELVGQAAAGDEVSTMGGQQSGASLAAAAFGGAPGLLCSSPVLTQAEADQVARAGFNDSVLQLISGPGTCLGRADLRPGRVIKVDGIGSRFSGRYYVRSTAHCYEAGNLYRTHFTAWRNAA